MVSENIIDWLISGDPSVSWQCMKDLMNASSATWMKERMKISQEGWGRRLLDHQDEKGTWANGIYSPKWTSTTYTLLQLKKMGLEPGNEAARRACMILLDKGFSDDHGINYFASRDQSETCVSGLILSLLSYFNIEDERLPKLARFLLKEQLADGGWNCLHIFGDTHSSFHTTILVLEGLREYEKQHKEYLENSTQDQNKDSIEKPHKDILKDILRTRQEALEFLSIHHFYKSHRSGKVFDPRMTRFSFPPRWRYDVMRCFDFLQEVDAPWDDRMTDAAGLILKKRNKEGLWPLQGKHSGRVWFDMEQAGQPSRWNTLRGYRILLWLQKVQPSNVFP